MQAKTEIDDMFMSCTQQYLTVNTHEYHSQNNKYNLI